MTALFRLFALTLLLSLALPATANEAASKGDLDAQKEFLLLKIDNSREFVQKDIEGFKDRIGALDKRIDDQNKRIEDQSRRIEDIGRSVDMFHMIVSFLGITVTVLLALGGLVGYRSVAGKAKEEAESASKEWFKDNRQILADGIRELIEQGKQKIDDVVADLKNTKEKIQAGMNAPNEQAQPIISPDEEKVLRRSNEQTRKKPEANYSYEDWSIRAFFAYHDGQYEDAALYWKNASSILSAAAIDKAQALFNRAVTLRQVQKPDEAIDTYEKLIATYSPGDTPAIREVVAGAMNNLGFVLEKTQKPDEAIATYEKLISIYSPDDTPAIREQVAIAMNGIGFTHLMEAKKAWEDRDRAFTLLRDAQADLRGSLDRRTDCGITRGNLAYVQWLLGDQQAAEENFRTALASTRNGGEKLYRDTLDDIALHTIPEDDVFRSMVERLWDEFQGGSPPPHDLESRMVIP